MLGGLFGSIQKALQLVCNRVHHSEHREDTSDDGAQLREEVQQRHAHAGGLDHERGQLVDEEDARQNSFSMLSL